MSQLSSEHAGSTAHINRRGYTAADRANVLSNLNIPKSQFMDAINFEALTHSSDEADENPRLKDEPDAMQNQKGLGKMDRAI